MLRAAFHKYNDEHFRKRPFYGRMPWRNILEPSLTSSAELFDQPNEEEMKWVFGKFDSNKDGKISFEEYKAVAKLLGRGIGEIQKVKVFKVVDSDGDGLIDFKEFMDMFNVEGKMIETEIKKVFEVFDLNGDGGITAEELSHVLKTLGESSNIDACRRMVRNVDANGDGFIDLNEFKRMMLSD